MVPRNEKWLHGVPSNYVSYKLSIENSDGIPTDHLDVIFQWKDAARLDIFSLKYVTPAVHQRVGEFSALKRLKFLRLDVQQSVDHPTVTVRPFLENIPTLKELQLKPRSMSPDDIFKFMESQDLPDGWIIKRGMDETFNLIIRVVRKKTKPLLH